MAEGGPVQSLRKAQLLHLFIFLLPIQLDILNPITHCSCFFLCKENKAISRYALKCFDGLQIYAKVGEKVADKSEMLTPGSQEQEHNHKQKHK